MFFKILNVSMFLLSINTYCIIINNTKHIIRLRYVFKKNNKKNTKHDIDDLGLPVSSCSTSNSNQPELKSP